MVGPRLEERVLIIAPVGQDAATMAELMEAEGIAGVACVDLAKCTEEISRGAGAVLITEEALETSDSMALFEFLKGQPPWSELPVIILTSGGESRLGSLLDLAARAAGSVTLLERPMSPPTLLRSVQVALRSRRRQYQVRDLLAEQQRFGAELERLVEERTARLQELVAELEHFSYTITHDMRAPLRAMRGLAEILRETEETAAVEERKKFIQRIITAAERMDGLIADALHYSKVVRQELPLSPVDVAKLLRGMLETYPEFQDSNAEIRVEGELPLVMGNEAGLTQCFSNLLDNAVKFTKPGQKAQVRLWGEIVKTERGNGNGGPQKAVRIWVQDDGIGISPAMLPRVFEMFSRGSHASSGTGIGLALVRKVVGRMGGRVGVESEAGRGCRFWVELKPVKAGRTIS